MLASPSTGQAPVYLWLAVAEGEMVSRRSQQIGRVVMPQASSLFTRLESTAEQLFHTRWLLPRSLRTYAFRRLFKRCRSGAPRCAVYLRAYAVPSQFISTR